MDQITNAIAAAAAILEKAATTAKAFVTQNTPESAVLAAITVAAQQWSAGSINGTQFTFLVFGALVTFAVAENSKDKAEIANP